ncbi:hypothetical protein L226DRAFT_608391 [Lentinus tigrinus ALCF2SS1-7]|uniref:Uncharacterized protein n=1 Tax=Lentinus tigrinus ALCF2SS1-6 TaxID=1328759 RepID=A0A5C2SV33_9APHY|nr:hypothetical protein L227DRAFT_648266 [Lentinus tigrinus ALCF2SS1-6]RPD81093.1 hypothetical protein L226DRAFT_608391 [Lentinus tigrinus ALCF2SS1-7]
MSDPAAYDAPPSPPPPSYEISQHEFDQKTSHVLEHSAAEPPRPRIDEDGFEIWDDAVYEARAGMDHLSLSPNGTSSQAQAHTHHARAASTSRSSNEASSSSPPAFTPVPGQWRVTGYGFPQEKAKQRQLPVSAEAVGGSSGSGSSIASSPSSSSSPPQVMQSPPQAVQSPPQEPPAPPSGIQPLRVAKKSRPRKERPAWYAEAGLGGNSPPPSPLASEASSSTGPRQVPLRRQLTVFNNTERELTPPPEFSAIGPSLDGPPYETLLTYEGTSPPPPSAPEPPAFEPLPPPVPPAAAPTIPQPRSPATPVPRSGSARLGPHPAHSQSLPQNHTAPSPRPHTVHHQTMPAVPQYGSSIRASLFEPGGKSNNTPRLSFNPQMAYAKPVAPAMPAFAADAEPQAVNPSAFYSHAVSAHYSFNVPARMRRPTQSEQPPVSQSSRSGYGAPDKAVASPRPSYAYGQANFQETAHNMGAAWGANTQQAWPAGGSSSSSVYRLE